MQAAIDRCIKGDVSVDLDLSATDTCHFALAPSDFLPLPLAVALSLLPEVASVTNQIQPRGRVNVTQPSRICTNFRS